MKPLNTKDSQLGFIGIGYMGQPITERLLEAGFKVIGYDRERKNVESIVPYGGAVAESVAELSRSCDVVLSCLPNDNAVMSVYGGPSGVFAAAARGTLVIDMSTVDPKTSRELAQIGADRGIDVLDVTISGSTPAAEKGQLILFAGGDKARFDSAEPVFQAIARKFFHVGPSGSGATMKLVVNALLGIGMQAIAEAVALGEKAGLERKRLLDVLSETAVVAPAHVGKLERAARGDYSPQFPIRLMNKDFGLILSLANAVGAQMPATGAAFEVNARQMEAGPEQDFSAVILQMEKRAQLDARDQTQAAKSATSK